VSPCRLRVSTFAFEPKADADLGVTLGLRVSCRVAVERHGPETVELVQLLGLGLAGDEQGDGGDARRE